MAEIEIERREPRRTGLWVAAAVGLLALAAVAWFLLAPREPIDGGAGEALDTAGAAAPFTPSPLAPGDTAAPYDTVEGSVPDTAGRTP